MNFQDLRKVEAYQFYLDVALRKASKKLDEKRDSLKASKLGKSKQLELMRVELVHEYLVDSLKKILVSFPITILCLLSFLLKTKPAALPRLRAVSTVIGSVFATPLTPSVPKSLFIKSLLIQ